MRMPFSEFMSSGDLKFIIVFSIFLSLAIFNFIKKLKARKNQNVSLENYYNLKIKTAGFWIIISSVLSLLLGLMHSFYSIGKAGGMAPNLIFQGVSYALITPVLGVCLFIIINILYRILSANPDNS